MLGSKTLRVVLAPDSKAGVSRFEWQGFGPKAATVPYVPDSKQDLASLRALAIAFLCLTHCRQFDRKDRSESVALTAPEALIARADYGGWRISSQRDRENWLRALGSGFERRHPQGARGRSPIGVLCQKLPGLLNEQDWEWSASRGKAGGVANFWCRDAAEHEVGASAERAGPRLVFRLDGEESDLPPDTDWLALARRMEEAKADEWTSLLTPPEVKADERLRSFQGYLREVAKECSQLVRRGGVASDAASRQQALRLAKVYVELSTETPRPAAVEEEREMVGRENLTALEALLESPDARVVLTGRPGSGKSTFLQYMTLCLATPLAGFDSGDSPLFGVDLPPALGRKRLLPLRVILRSFTPASTPGTSEDVVNHLIKLLDRGSHREAQAQLRDVLKAGLAFVFFDGLDEVPAPILPAVKQAITNFAQGDYRKCRVAVTCRVASYEQKDKLGRWVFRLSGFPEPHRIADLSSHLQARFVRESYAEMEQVVEEYRGEGAACAATLIRAINTPRLQAMAGNPFFLRSMVEIHRPDKPLPDTAAKLMDELVRSVLAESRKVEADKDDGSSSQEPELVSLLKPVYKGLETLRACLEEIAFAARQKRQQRGQEEDRLVDLDVLENRLNLHPAAPARCLIEALRHRAGLLQSEDGVNFEFAYRFEEFLAGCYLAKRKTGQDRAGRDIKPQFHLRAIDLLREQRDYARQPVVWAAGFNAHVQSGEEPTVNALVAALLPKDDTLAVGPGLADLELAAEIAGDAGMEKWPDILAPGADDTVRRLRALLEKVRDGAERFGIQARSRAASAIGWLGDPRRGVGLDKDGLPDLDFDTTQLPRGEFKCLEKDEPDEIKQPYRICRYPVTVQQFRAFATPENYGNPHWWTAALEAGVWEDGRLKMIDWTGGDEGGVSGPAMLEASFSVPNHPMVRVNWFEATAFCAWLSAKLDREIRLPHEAEWEQAARWAGKKAEKRTYPWGESAVEDLAKYCNWDGTGLGHTSAVGLFPDGRADCGALDLAGNVWEWCENWYDESSESSRVLRGGSWFLDHPERLSCSYRVGDHPSFRRDNCGFRCVVEVGASVR